MNKQYVLTEEEYDAILSEARNIKQRTPRDGYEHNIVSNSAEKIIEILEPNYDLG